MYRHLVIGKGEVGTALSYIFGADTFDIKDEEEKEDKYDIVHICFPYSEDFIEHVNGYRKKFNPEIVIIHSTVPIGTTRTLEAVHSPIRGVHPNLIEGIKTFEKYVGCANNEMGNKVVNIFKDYNIPCEKVISPEDSEAGKILSTTYYGWNILFEKYVHEFCQKNNLDFNIVYKDFNETYNDGYKKLGMEHVVRPVLKHMEGEIGGHCVIPNCRIVDLEPAKLILHKNKNI